MRVQMNLAKRKVSPFQNSAVVCPPEKNYVLTTFEGGSLRSLASYCHSDTFFVCFGNVIKYGKVAQIMIMGRTAAEQGREYETNESAFRVPRHYSPKVVRMQYLCGLAGVGGMKIHQKYTS